MANGLLVSILLATIIMPIVFSGAKNPRQGLRRVVIGMTIYIFVWVGYDVYMFLRLGGGN